MLMARLNRNASASTHSARGGFSSTVAPTPSKSGMTKRTMPQAAIPSKESLLRSMRLGPITARMVIPKARPPAGVRMVAIKVVSSANLALKPKRKQRPADDAMGGAAASSISDAWGLVASLAMFRRSSRAIDNPSTIDTSAGKAGRMKADRLGRNRAIRQPIARMNRAFLPSQWSVLIKGDGN